MLPWSLTSVTAPDSLQSTLVDARRPCDLSFVLGEKLSVMFFRPRNRFLS